MNFPNIEVRLVSLVKISNEAQSVTSGSLGMAANAIKGHARGPEFFQAGNDGLFAELRAARSKSNIPAGVHGSVAPASPTLTLPPASGDEGLTGFPHL